MVNKLMMALNSCFSLSFVVVLGTEPRTWHTLSLATPYLGFYIFQALGRGLERGLSCEEHLLFLQRT